MKRIFSLLLTMIIIIGVIAPCTAYAYTYGIYKDIYDDHWAFEAIAYATERRWFNGYEDGNFMPDNTISRAEAVKVIVTFLNRDIPDGTNSGFKDVNSSEWFAPYVEAGNDLLPNLVKGGDFKPNESITREDAIFALVRSLNINRLVEYLDMSGVTKFSDGSHVSEEVKPFMAIALQTAMISGYPDGTIRPKNSLTRAEFATLLYRAVLLKDGQSNSKMASIAKAEREEEVAENEEDKSLSLMSKFDGSFQDEIISLVNKIRKENGLKELSVSGNLANLAQAKAQDMKDNNYFSLTSPTYGSIYDMMDDFGVNYKKGAGANIAKDMNTPEDVVKSWMSSSNQKRVILQSSFTQTGIGYIPEGNIWVQVFIG